MAGRPKIYDEAAALDEAVKVFWKKGYENASSEDLLKAMGIGKGSFYLAFKGGKRELFEKSMKRVVDKYFSEFRQAVAQSPDPLQLIRDFFLSLAGNKSPIGNQGCYFGNALIQVADSETGLKEMAAKHLHLLKSIFREAMQRSKTMGLLQSDHSAEQLSYYLINLWNGINVTRRMEHRPAKLAEVIRMNLRILD